MLRGKKTFKCSKCGCTFEAMDVEWRATVYSMPQPCPQCGSRRTAPKGLFGFINPVYRTIWAQMGEE